MEAFWEEIRRCLADSISELNRLVEEVRLLVEEHSGQSFELPVVRLRRAEAVPETLIQGRVYSIPMPASSNADTYSNHASVVKEGEFWTIAWNRKTVRMKASKGVRLLAALIEHPGRQFHVLDLEGYERKDEPGESDILSVSSNGGPILDDRAKNSYKARLRDLRDELEEAQSFNDIFRASKIKSEMAILTKELSRAFGLHGESRLAISDAERARVRVTLAVKGAIAKISKYNPPVGWHLTSSVRTGSFCVYLPAPIAEDHDRREG
jgi:hypothetical protein